MLRFFHKVASARGGLWKGLLTRGFSSGRSWNEAPIKEELIKGHECQASDSDPLIAKSNKAGSVSSNLDLNQQVESEKGRPSQVPKVNEKRHSSIQRRQMPSKQHQYPKGYAPGKAADKIKKLLDPAKAPVSSEAPEWFQGVSFQPFQSNLGSALALLSKQQDEITRMLEEENALLEYLVQDRRSKRMSKSDSLETKGAQHVSISSLKGDFGKVHAADIRRDDRRGERS